MRTANMLLGNVRVITSVTSETKELATGAINGTNKVFTTSQPYVSGKITVLLNGLKEYDFTEIDDTTIELTTAPKNAGFTDKIELIYTKK